jgi:hypothetical protein
MGRALNHRLIMCADMKKYIISPKKTKALALIETGRAQDGKIK